MQLEFYNCSDDFRVVNKQIGSNIWSASSINPVEPVDLIKPTFIIANDPAMPNTFNYAYCPEIHRYYFITAQTALVGNKRAIECLVDVRKSFVNSQIPVVVIRNEFARNSDIPDNEFPIDPTLHTFKVISLNGDVFSDSYRVIRTANVGEIPEV